MPFAVAAVFTVQVWIANGQVALTRERGKWTVPVQFGDRVLNAHHIALRRIARAQAKTINLRKKR